MIGEGGRAVPVTVSNGRVSLLRYTFVPEGIDTAEGHLQASGMDGSRIDTAAFNSLNSVSSYVPLFYYRLLYIEMGLFLVCFFYETLFPFHEHCEKLSPTEAKSKKQTWLNRTTRSPKSAIIVVVVIGQTLSFLFLSFKLTIH